MKYYIVESVEWDPSIEDLTSFHYLIAGESYASAVAVLTAAVGENLNSFTAQEVESFDGIFSLKETEYESFGGGR